MSHKFTVGQSVIFLPGASAIAGSATTTATVARLLPKQNGDYQYHISLPPDGQQRCVLEKELQPSKTTKTAWPT